MGACVNNYRYLKRLFDCSIAISLFLITIPVFVLLALIIRIGMGRPVFFKQIRPGYKAVPFELIKFRTMSDLIEVNGQTAPDEMRLTKLGKFIRQTSLDELPQLINVLKGDMSLIGPRPLLMEYLPLYSQEQARRHHVKPGITGWAQVNGRNAISWNERFRLDVWYVDHCSLILDLKILGLTCIKVLKRDGVNEKNQATTTKFKGNSHG